MDDRAETGLAVREHVGQVVAELLRQFPSLREIRARFPERGEDDAMVLIVAPDAKTLDAATVAAIKMTEPMLDADDLWISSQGAVAPPTPLSPTFRPLNGRKQRGRRSAASP